jgi:hypothetical protein
MTGYETLCSILTNDTTLKGLAVGGIFVSFPDSFDSLPVISYASTTRDAINSFDRQDKMSNFTVDIWSLSDETNITIATQIETLLFHTFIQGQGTDATEKNLHHKSMKFNILN